VILRSEFAAWRQKQHEAAPSLTKDRASLPRILVTMGGSDPAGLTLKVVRALNQLNSDFQALIVIGPGFKHHMSLHELLHKSHRYFEIRENVSDMVTLMSNAEIAITSFGVTAYELAAAGIPSIFMCLTKDHSESASAFVDKDIALNLGVHDQVSESTLSEAIRHLTDNEMIRRDMGKRAQQLVDGRGASRIAKLIKERMKHD
jgi:spore coat polysaccharide biosynthesis protein SpsF